VARGMADGKWRCQTNDSSKGHAMYKPTKPSHRAGILLSLVLLALAPTAGANAGTDSVSPDRRPSFENCLLTRIGTQLVRCDNLTGAGVPAPYWIPEQ
jgi:hypothetical protein